VSQPYRPHAVVPEPRPLRGVEREESGTAPEGSAPRLGSRRLALIGLVALIGALSLHATLATQSGRYVPDTLLEDVVAPQHYLSQQLYLWDDARNLGRPRTDFSPATTAFQAAVAKLDSSPWRVERLTHALYLTLAAAGVILLLLAFRPHLGLEHAVAPFVYAFSPFTSQLLLPSGLFLYYALAPWFAWFVVRGVRHDDPWRWAAAFALAMAACGATNSAALGFALVPAALTGLYFAVFVPDGLRRLWRWVWRAGVLSALTCSAALVVLWASGSTVSANLQTTESPKDIAGTSSWSESWRGLGFWLTYSPNLGGASRAPVSAYFTQPIVIAATFVAAFGALLSLAFVRWRHRLLFGAMVLLSLLLMVGIHDAAGPSPFGRLLAFAFDHSQFVLGFRNTYKAGPGLLLGMGVLLGIGLATAMATARRSFRERADGFGRLRPVALGIALPVLVAVALVVASFPFWSDRVYSADGFKFIPGYWGRAFAYLDAQKQPGRMLVLPGTSLASYRWGHANDGLFNGLSPLSPVSNRVLPQGTSESADLVTAIDQYVNSPGYVPGTLAPILRRLGVQWVLLQNDLDWQRTGLPRPSTYDALRSDPGLTLAAAFGGRGENTTSRGDLGSTLLGETSLPPVEIYRVRGAPPPHPRLLGGPPLLVDGAGDSWPALASAGLLGGPPIAYTGAAGADFLRGMIGSGNRVVVTDGNRRRESQAGIGSTSLSPTLEAGAGGDRAGNLFGSTDTQSVATYRDASSISASRYGFPLAPFEAASRPANAFDGVESTAWRVRGPLGPDGESLTVDLRAPTDVTEVSVLPQAAEPWWIDAVEVTALSRDGHSTERTLRFRGPIPRRSSVRLNATGVTQVEFRIRDVRGPGPVGLAGVGIAEAGVETPHGPLDLREFVRTPDDLAVRAADDGRLRASLAANPPLYELRRLVGTGVQDEETELRREITTFGDHRYRLGASARLDSRSADSAVDGLLGRRVSAIGSSRYNGDLAGAGPNAFDNDLSTGWEPYARPGERLDLRFPETAVRTVEVLAVSGGGHAADRSQVTGVAVAVGEGKPRVTRATLRCAAAPSPTGACLRRFVVRVPATRTGRLSVTLTGVKPLIGRFGAQPAKVAEVRVNGRSWPGLSSTSAGVGCAPLFAVDGRPVPMRLPSSTELLSGGILHLDACRSIRLESGSHRVESLPGLSGAVLTASMVPGGEKVARTPERIRGGNVELLGHSPTRLDLHVRAPGHALLVGEMPAHDGWSADGGDLRRYPVPLDTFSAWTVESPIDGGVTLRFEPQRIYEIAIALSLAAAAWCLWRVTRRRGARPDDG
jgi:arabinofuranan 3-O-arabinosyltransferase